MPCERDEVIGRNNGVLARPPKLNVSEVVTGLALIRGDGDVIPTRDGILYGVLGFVTLARGRTAALMDVEGSVVVAMPDVPEGPVGGNPRVDGRLLALCNGFNWPKFRVVTPPIVCRETGLHTRRNTYTCTHSQL